MGENRCLQAAGCIACLLVLFVFSSVLQCCAAAAAAAPTNGCAAVVPRRQAQLLSVANRRVALGNGNSLTQPDPTPTCSTRSCSAHILSALHAGHRLHRLYAVTRAAPWCRRCPTYERPSRLIREPGGGHGRNSASQRRNITTTQGLVSDRGQHADWTGLA